MQVPAPLYLFLDYMTKEQMLALESSVVQFREGLPEKARPAVAEFLQRVAANPELVDINIECEDLDRSFWFAFDRPEELHGFFVKLNRYFNAG